MNEPMSGIELPKYRCHKEVWALKIKDLCVQVRPWPDPKAERPLEIRTYTQMATEPLGEAMTLDYGIVPEDSRYGIIWLGVSWFVMHTPKAGGYYVVYKDGYTSYSPAEAFEDGYTLI